MKKFHIAVAVTDIDASVQDYSARLGLAPDAVVAGEYALWRTDTLNFSIRRTSDLPGTLRHVGWENPDASSFTTSRDVNGLTWEEFTAKQQEEEITAAWPSSEYRAPS
jgi:hypothetical protein